MKEIKKIDSKKNSPKSLPQNTKVSIKIIITKKDIEEIRKNKGKICPF